MDKVPTFCFPQLNMSAYIRGGQTTARKGILCSSQDSHTNIDSHRVYVKVILSIRLEFSRIYSVYVYYSVNVK